MQLIGPFLCIPFHIFVVPSTNNPLHKFSCARWNFRLCENAKPHRFLLKNIY